MSTPTSGMTLNEYQAHAGRTAPRELKAYPKVVQAAQTLFDRSDEGLGYMGGLPRASTELLKLHDIFVWALGLAGEAGEVCDLLKKVHGHGKAYDADKMKKELGDVLWYLANLASAHGFNLSEVAEANVEKLQARYPNGFTVAAAQARADENLALPLHDDDAEHERRGSCSYCEAP